MCHAPSSRDTGGERRPRNKRRGRALTRRFSELSGSFLPDVRMPGAIPVIGAGVVLVAAAVLASLMPAARAARVDVIQALRSE